MELWFIFCLHEVIKWQKKVKNKIMTKLVKIAGTIACAIFILV